MSDHVDLGPFRAERLISNGTRTQVWAARTAAGEPVAVKLARNEEVRTSILREVSVYRRLEPPGVPRFIDAAEDGRWLAMERVEGVPINRWARNAHEKTLADVGVQILDILHHLHSQGVIHGDLKPSNVLIAQDGSPTLVDFGSATFIDQPMKGFHGTLGFAAPEVLAGEPPTALSDMYGFGALLYACLTDRPPFVLPDPAALAYVPLVSLPAPPSTWVPGIPARVDHLVLALLARNPQRRPSDARAIAQALLTTPRAKMARRVLGMHDERDELRRLVIAAAQGERGCAVVYGPPGSGRLTLITEAVEAANREGLRYLAGVAPTGALDAVRDCVGVPVLVFRSSQRRAQTVAQELLELDRPVLVLVHSDRPLPRLTTAHQITPTPLDRTEASQLVASLGGDMSLADQWREASMGLPIGIIGRCRAWLRTRQEEHSVDRSAFPGRSRRILKALDVHGQVPVAELAAELGMPEHAIIDHCEVLLAEGVVEAAENGRSLRLNHREST